MEGECITILREKLNTKEPRKEPPRKLLVDLIKTDYLLGMYKLGTHNKTKARHVFHELVNVIFLNGAFDDFSKKQYEDIIKKECPYNKAHRVCKEMDLSGGVLNQSGINILRRVERLGKYGRNGYLCSTNKIQKIQEIVHEHMSKMCPYKLITEDGIDGVAFEPTMMLDALLKLFKLYGIARTEGNVKLSSTLDGADLSRNIQHVTCRMKIVDPRAVNPCTGIPLGLEGVQSRDFCFPIQILLTKDSKTLHQTHFTDFFDWTRELSTKGVLDYKPFDISSPQDVSSFWKCVGRGGACKQTEYFCHCCDIKSSNFIIPNLVKCSHCIRTNNQHQCYHHDVCDSSFMESVKNELKLLLETHDHLFDSDKIAKMTIKLDPNDVFAAEDITNIDYEPPNEEKRIEFSNKLNENLALLGLSRRRNFATRRNLLREHLLALGRKLKIEHAIENFSLQNSMIIIEQAIPCILHMENRVGDKILKLLLIEGMIERDSDKKEQKNMIHEVNIIINTKILGTRRRKSNWSVNLTKEGTVADQPMTNNHTRKIINGLEQILHLCVSDSDRKERWIECIEVWRELVEVARQKEEFSDSQIDSFQLLCDAFFRKWVALHKADGVGNYVHMIGAGHLSYYLRRWRNLYRYSQQGWEALNSQIKTVYFRRTQRGGHKGGGEFNSKVEPIAKWVQRNLFWKAGLDVIFEDD